ncbi:MAG: hypothetical protein CJBNEKGG_01693 [Prosthecobacter sp.]|nr:hypothetical protein [Prosthecobacter sp.]
MRRVERLDIPAAVVRYLDRRQLRADTERAAGTLDIEKTWKNARQTQKLGLVKQQLQQMAGGRQRCMYCSDSAGTDIEHFWPKSVYPERMFRWPNMLLCCTGCGRDCKGSQFPLVNGQPALLNPTVDDPWEFLDFSPATGILFARMAPDGSTTMMGTETERVFQFAKRDAVTLGYQRSFRRIRKVIATAVDDPAIDPAVFISDLRDADEHGILGWCFRGAGINEPPMTTLRQARPAVWAACVTAFKNY